MAVMEMNLRDGLIIIGFLVIAIVLFDGYRRIKRSSGRVNAMRLDDEPHDSNLADLHGNAELPNGGARVVSSARASDIPTTFSATDASSSLDATPIISVKAVTQPIVQTPKNHTAAKPEKIHDRSKHASTALHCDEVIIIHVQAAKDRPFDGERLLKIVEGKGLRYGDMGIFHYFEDEIEKEQPRFSMANGVEPGHFNIDTMRETQILAVSFFMTLPGFGVPLRTFECMMSTITAITQALGGTLRDEDRNLLTQQARAHYRQRVIDFERKQLLKR